MVRRPSTKSTPLNFIKRSPLVDITNDMTPLKEYLPPPPIYPPASPVLSYASSMPSSYDSTAESFLNMHSVMPSTPISVMETEVIPESPHPNRFYDIEDLLNDDPIELEPSELKIPDIKLHKIRVHPRPKPTTDWITKKNPKQFRVGLSKHSRVDPLHVKLRKDKKTS